ncbi:MAG TPA: POTRA domain-containing protein, partial [Bacteroidales bacterium]|nr:POTRA domain-containing protein [Bacteroidales bacterium]
MRYSVYIIYFVFFLTPFLTNGQEKEYVLHLQSQQAIPESIQKKYHRIHGDSLYITKKVSRLLHDFYALGFLAASIDRLYFTSDTAHAQLYCGKKYYRGIIDYSNLGQPIKEQMTIRSNRKKKRVFQLSEILALKEHIISAYENSGYPFASLKFDPIQFDDSLIHLKINSVKNDFYRIDSIIVKGEAKISPYYLYRYIQIQPGNVFKQKKINEMDKRINDLNFLSAIKPAEIEFKKKNAD